MLEYLQNFLKAFGLQTTGRDSLFRSVQDIYVILLIAVPLSILVYLLFSKYKHHMLVDLGHHRWLVK